MRLSLVFTHCLEKVFHRQNMPPVAVENRLSGLNNEVLSWQAVYCLQTPGNETRHELCYQLDGPLAEYISVRQVQSVPCILATVGWSRIRRRAFSTTTTATVRTTW